MKINQYDIFEALTDIDDKFIAAAHPRELTDDPAVFRPEPRKPLWKTLLPVAACAAVLVTAGIFGARYFFARLDSEPQNSNSLSSGGFTSEYITDNTDNTGFQAEAPALQEITVPVTDVRNNFVMEEFSGYQFSALKDGVVLNGYEMNGIDMKLIDGELQNLFLDDLNGDGARELCATVKGERGEGGISVVIVDFVNSEYYTTCILSNSLFRLELDNGELKMVKTTGADMVFYKSPSPENVNLARLLTDIRPMEIDGIERFGLPEFPELFFIKQGSNLIMGNNSSNTMLRYVLNGEKFFLADLNGDGMRELCSYGVFGGEPDYSYITVYDIANDATYAWNAVFEQRIWIDLKVDELYMKIRDDGNNVIYEILLSDEFTTQSFTEVAKSEFDEIPLGVNRIFELPDFEGITFEVYINGIVISMEGCPLNASRVDYAYLADLDGDGCRELILIGSYPGGVKIFGITENGEFGVAEYSNGYSINISVVQSEDRLVWITEGGKEKQVEFSKSDLVPLSFGDVIE